MKTPTAVILLSQPVHDEIPLEKMRQAFSVAPQVVASVKIEPARLALAATAAADWTSLRREQEALVASKLAPTIAEHSEADVAYFGIAPIPLVIHLGALVERWRRLHVFQLRHDGSGSWAWWTAEECGGPALEVVLEGEPRDLVRSEDDVILRVSVTARIDLEDCRKAAPQAGTEIEVRVASPGEDVLRTPEDLEAVAAAFKLALDAVSERRPNARRVHLFAAVPSGLAFRLGTLLSATRHAPVQTYQYIRSSDTRYHPALLIGEVTRPRRALSEEEKARAVTMREAWREQAERFLGFVDHIKDQHAKTPASWFDPLFPYATDCSPFKHWPQLARLDETRAAKPVDDSGHDVEDGFRFDEGAFKWFLGDDLLSAIGERIGDRSMCQRALRMLILHESVHLVSHRLTSATAPGIRRLPKILEEVDYQADVWAILHEYAYTRHTEPTQAKEPRALFLAILKTAVETMWAFDASPERRETMEVRRVNRYLIWYWQWLRLERCESLGEILEVLGRKPLIELAGPRVLLEGDRVLYDLRGHWRSELEVGALLEHNGIARHGQTSATSVSYLIEGLRERDGEKVKLVLRSILDQDVPRQKPAR